jgi:murein DD-endopeptidase MepM/ murein hydrolase activator NlpD
MSTITRRFTLSLFILAVLASTMAFAMPAFAAQECRAYHTVQAGETLYRIGLKYNLTWDKIAKTNNLADANKIMAGQVLCVPGKAGGTQTPTPQPTPAPTRITFAHGAISGTAQGTVTAPTRQEFVLRTLKGQSMTVEIISKDNKANFAVIGPDGQPLKRLENEDRKWTSTLSADGDYRISVATATGSISYSLVVTIPPKK